MRPEPTFAHPDRGRGFVYVLIGWLLVTAASGIFPAPGTCRAENGNPVIDTIDIRIAGSPENAGKMAQIARQLISLRQGERFSDNRFSASVSALRDSGLFAEIDIPDPDWSKDRVNLVFRLEPYARIKSIRIHGGFPLLEREIRNAMSIEAGDACVPEKISGQKQNIEFLFPEEGYFRPRVALPTHKDPDDGHCIVDVRINRGPFYRVEAVRFRGDRQFASARLKMRLDTWQASLLFGGASRFVERDLEQDVKTLRRFYRGKGYAEVEIETDVEKDPKTGAVRIHFNISEGPRYRVSFKGNAAFWGFTLKKDLVLFTEGNQNDFGLRKSIRNIKRRYREAGYLDAQVRAEETGPGEKADKPVKAVSIKIREGPQYIVDSVSISGNLAFDTETIRAQMLTAPPAFFHKGAYVPETLEEDIRAIQALYLQSGYRSATVEKTVKKQQDADGQEVIPVSVQLRIHKGVQTMVRGISIKGETPIPEKRATKRFELKTGDPFVQEQVKTDQNALAAAVSEQGYPHVSVDPRVSISEDQTEARITYRVDPGPKVEMGEVFFAGNFHTRFRTLDREVQIAPGEPFSLSEMLETQRRIRSLEAVDTARFETFGLEEKAGRVNMLADLREIRPYYLELASGYDTRRLFYIQTAAGNRNLLGLNKELRFSLEWSQIGYRADLDFREPRFLGTQISAGTNLYTEKREEINQNFGTRTYGVSQGFSRPLTSRLNTSLNFRYESRDQYRTDNEPVPADEADEYRARTIVAVSPGLDYNSTDSFVRPSKGIRASATVDASRGLDNSLDDFLKYRLDARYYYSPFKRLTLAFRGRLGYIDPYGENERVPEDQLFFLGGTADVRGFSENKLRFDENGDPVGGRTSMLASAEARYDMGMNFELAAFYDTGAIREPLTDAGSDDLRAAAGLALRYITPIGPIGGMYGWKLDRRPGESPGAFHFSIGYTF
ncbi:MAG: outer membrane protein assembly factor BamA [Desulfobacteraceae bacterium]|nr:outer membrane protein assembly factor BamA [Desulfobacteraceae bacterium]